MTDGQVSQLTVRALSEGSDAQVSQFAVRSVFNYPAEAGQVSQVIVRTFVEPTPDLRLSQMVVRTILRGRVDEPKVRAWTFTMDGHDFYVLRLGMQETLVYDTHTGEWHVWGTGTTSLWRAYTGCNWIGGRSLALNWSNIICGDDGNGALYFLSPDDDTDDDALFGSETPRAFRRRATGQLVIKAGYMSVPCYGVQLAGSSGKAGTVTLSISDDRGHNYTDMGDITLVADEYSARVNWRSLGSMKAPGRLFRITDTGSLKRIDGLETDG